MGELHDLIRTIGKQEALRCDLDRAAVEAAATYLADEDGAIGCLYAGWCQASLPHKRILDDQVWEVTSERIRLVVRPGLRPARGIAGKLQPVGVPYGARARLIMLYLQAEALRTQSPEVRLGKSMRHWMQRMGVPIGGESIKAIREQADRIAHCSLTFHVQRDGAIGLVNQTIMEEAMFVPSEDGQGDLFTEKARLSDAFFKQLKKHPVPIEESAISSISNNSQAIDIYCWLAYRLHSLGGPVPITWAALKGQFGLGTGRLIDFKRLFLRSLTLALAVYPDAKVGVEDGGLVLHPSRPPVSPRQISA